MYSAYTYTLSEYRILECFLPWKETLVQMLPNNKHFKVTNKLSKAGLTDALCNHNPKDNGQCVVNSNGPPLIFFCKKCGSEFFRENMIRAFLRNFAHIFEQFSYFFLELKYYMYTSTKKAFVQRKLFSPLILFIGYF